VHDRDTATQSNIRYMSEVMFVDEASDAHLSSRYFRWLSAWGSTS